MTGFYVFLWNFCDLILNFAIIISYHLPVDILAAIKISKEIADTSFLVDDLCYHENWCLIRYVLVFWCFDDLCYHDNWCLIR